MLRHLLELENVVLFVKENLTNSRVEQNLWIFVRKNMVGTPKWVYGRNNCLPREDWSEISTTFILGIGCIHTQLFSSIVCRFVCGKHQLLLCVSGLYTRYTDKASKGGRMYCEQVVLLHFSSIWFCVFRSLFPFSRTINIMALMWKQHLYFNSLFIMEWWWW